MLEDTRTKLREAAFFLRRLERVSGRIVRNEPEGPRFYLSAFLTAGRSVGDYIAKEGADGYRAWWNERRKTLTARQAELLGFTNRQRVKAVHIAGPEVEDAVEVVPAGEAQGEMELSGGSLVLFSSAGLGPSATEVYRTTLRFKTFPDTPIVEVCREYLELMTVLVDEFEACETRLVAQVSNTGQESGSQC